MEDIDYEGWYPQVPPVMGIKELAELLHTNEQIIRAWVREGTIPAHRKPGDRKATSQKHISTELMRWHDHFTRVRSQASESR